MADRPVINLANPKIGNFMWEAPELLGELFAELEPEIKRHLEEHISTVLSGFLHQVMAATLSAGVYPPLACAFFHRIEDDARLQIAESLAAIAKIGGEAGFNPPHHD